MKLFSEHIPPEFLNNPNVASFVKVLDELQFFKNGEISKFENFLNYYAQSNTQQQKHFLYSLGQLPLFTFLTYDLFVKMVDKSYEFLTYKGSEKGLTAYFNGVFGFMHTFEEDTNFWSPVVFQLSDPNYGYLPDGNDLGVAKDTPEKYPFLLSGNMKQYYNRVELTLTDTQDILDTTEKRKEFSEFVPELLCMSDIKTCNYTIHFEDDDNNILETLNF